MFTTYNYFKQYNNNKEIEDYKSFYRKFSNEKEFGSEFTNFDHLVKNRFTDTIGHLYNIILRRQPKNILDIGCGNGVNLPLANMFPFVDYHGLDYAEKTVEVAKKQYPNIKFHTGDAFNLSFEDKTFDMSILSSVLILYKNFDDQIKLIKEASRVINNNGVFVLIVWNESFLLKKCIQFSRILGKIKKQNLPTDFMGIHFKFKEIKKLAKKSDMKITQRINTGYNYGVLESVRYLNMSKYNRKFGVSESESRNIHSQSIVEDLQNQAGGNKALTRLLFAISKVKPNLFSMFSIYIMQKK